MRSRWIRIGLGHGVLALLLAAIAWPLPYYSEGPGPARDVVPRIIYQGMPRYDPIGQLDLTTVRYEQLTGLTWLRAQLDDTLSVVKANVVYPPDVPVSVTQQRGVSQMDQSQIAATAVALHALHKYPKQHGEGALIENVVPTCPADGKLYPGDIITSVDGTPVRTADQASKLFDTIPNDEPLHFELDVDGNTVQQTFTRAPCAPKNEKLVGISMIDAFPIDVTYTADEIGGPSAGLMWALGLYELLTVDDITARPHDRRHRRDPPGRHGLSDRRDPGQGRRGAAGRSDHLLGPQGQHGRPPGGRHRRHAGDLREDVRRCAAGIAANRSDGLK